MSDVITKLQQLNKSDEYPLHMPGHKRNYQAGFGVNLNAIDSTGTLTDSNRIGEANILAGAYGIDITEIIGYDNLYEAEGMLKDAMERAARVYGAEETFFLVNGSTVGILSAITAVAKRGERILVARNCHKAVFHAIELRELQAVYLHPEYVSDWDMPGTISVEEVRAQLEKYPDCKAVVITSPTYEGLVSDVEAIAGLAHEKGIPLIVDEAHGAHLIFDERFPKSALQCDADIVIQSMHKTLPSFTQTALIHMKKGYVDTARIKEYIGYYQTSSPSYLFMAGMDYCIGQIEEKGSHLWDSFFAMREEFLKKMVMLKYIRILQGNDPCKLVISVKGTSLSGNELQKILLDKYHIQLEMAAETYVLGIVTMCDTKDGFDRLARALLEIDGKLQREVCKERTEVQKELQGKDANKQDCSEIESKDDKNNSVLFSANTCTEDIIYTLAEVREKETEKIPLKDSEGRICASFVNLYPPGIPLFLPGEKIAEEHIILMERYLKKGMHVQGIADGRICVCK